MVNKAKKQGTTYETNIVKRLNKNSNMKAQRFAEGGSNDLGDIQLFVDGVEYFIEAKSRQNLNIHQSLEKALEKYGSEGSGKNLPFSSLSDDLKKKKKEDE